MLDVHRALKPRGAFIQSSCLRGKKKKRGCGRDWELWPKKRDFIKGRGRKEKMAPAAVALERFSTAEQRQESVVVDVKWLNRPGRGRKVQKGTSIPVPVITPHFVHRQAHYLISLDALLRVRSLSELKANLQVPCCLGEPWRNQMISVLEYGQSCSYSLDVTGREMIMLITVNKKKI